MSPYTSPLEQKAYSQGYEAREKNKPFRCPFNNYPSPKLVKIWEEGWRAANLALSKRVPGIESHGVELENRAE